MKYDPDMHTSNHHNQLEILSALPKVGQELPLRTVEEGEYPEEKNIGSNRVYLPVIVSE